MKVHIERRFDRMAVDIYVYESLPNMKHRLLRWKGAGEVEWIDTNDGEQPMGPSLQLPVEVLEQLVSEAQDFLPPSAAVGAALKDTQEVRDKLLGMVERIVDADLAREAKAHG